MLFSKKPRVLFAANLYPEHNFMMQRYDSIVAALKGYQVSFIDIFDFYGNHSQAMELESKCFDSEYLQSFFDNTDIIELNERFSDHVLSLEWDILCLCTISHYSYFLLPATLRKFSQKNKLVVGFFGDDETMYQRNKYWTGLFDAVVAYSEFEVKQYQTLNPYSYLLPIGVGKIPIVYPVENRDIEVVFVGRPYGIRVDIIRAIKNAGINIQVFGSKRWLDYPDLKNIYKGFLAQEDFWQTLGRAKIALNLMEDVSGKKPHINAKVFEAAMVKALSVVTYYPPFETTYGLVDSESIIFYRNIEDLITKLKYYLADDKKRRQIAQNLHRQLLPRFSYGDLYRKLFNDLESQWQHGHTASALRQPEIDKHFSVIQFVTNASDYDQARQFWSQYPDKNIIFVSRTRFSYSNVYSITKLRKKLRQELSISLSDYVILVAPQTVYDPVVFNLIRRYDAAGIIPGGMQCDSIVLRKRLHKSKYLLDLNSSIWRRDTFLKNVSIILYGYQLFGALIPTHFVKTKLDLMPVFLNTVCEGHSVVQFERYRWIVDYFRRLKHVLEKR